MTTSRKLSLSVALFLAGAVCVWIAGTAGSVVPLFVAWIPLLAVPWILTRPEPADSTAADLGPPPGSDLDEVPGGEGDLDHAEHDRAEPGRRPDPDEGTLGTGRRPGRDPDAG